MTTINCCNYYYLDFYICLTETRRDNSIDSRTIVGRDDLVFFRNDRTINGGGVLVAVSNQLNSKEIYMPNCDCEVLFVRIDNCIMLCCYYRSHHGDQISSIIERVNHVTPQTQLTTLL